jgi:hypothetical protein
VGKVAGQGAGAESAAGRVVCTWRAAQDACLQALAALLHTTAQHEPHAAPLRPPHLQQLGLSLLRPEVLTQIGEPRQPGALV